MEAFMKMIVLAFVAFVVLENSQAVSAVSPTNSSSVNSTVTTTPSVNVTKPTFNSTTVSSTANQTTAGNTTMTTTHAGTASLVQTWTGLTLMLLILLLLSV